MAAGDANQETGLYEVFEEARKGDDAALNRVLEALRPGLLMTIRARVRSARATEAVAEELAQDALLRVAEGLAGCRAQTAAQLMAWCRTIARRVVIDWYRRREEEQKRRTSGELTQLLPEGLGVGRNGETVETADSPQAAKIDKVLGQLLLEAQNALSEGTQEVLRRRLLYGEIWRVVGEAVGTSPGGAKRRYQRAMDRLRREVLERIRGVADDELRRELLRRVGEEPP